VTAHSNLLPPPRVVDLVCKVGTHAEVFGLKVGVENDGGSVSDYLKLIEQVDSEFVGATLDLGHWLFSKKCSSSRTLVNECER